MRKLLIGIAATTVIVIGLPVLQAHAQADLSRGAAVITGTASQYSPVKKAACQGPGPYCGPGYVRACGPYRCWCRPCR